MRAVWLGKVRTILKAIEIRSSALTITSRCFTAMCMSGFGHPTNCVEREGSARCPEPKDSHGRERPPVSDKKGDPSAGGFTVPSTLTHSQLPQTHSKERENKLDTWHLYKDQSSGWIKRKTSCFGSIFSPVNFWLFSVRVIRSSVRKFD